MKEKKYVPKILSMETMKRKKKQRNRFCVQTSRPKNRIEMLGRQPRASGMVLTFFELVRSWGLWHSSGRLIRASGPLADAQQRQSLSVWGHRWTDREAEPFASGSMGHQARGRRPRCTTFGASMPNAMHRIRTRRHGVYL